MSILQMRDQIAGAIKEAVPALRASTPHGGRFNLQELRRYAVSAPCILVACLGAPKITEEGSQLVAKLRWAAFVLARDTKGQSRGAEALLLVEALLGVIRGNRWELEHAHRPESLRAENLYSGKLDTHGVALWAITWEQSLDLEVLDLSQLSDFDTLSYAVSEEDPSIFEVRNP